jgi:tetratricopeptide (TPR) repeat protein
MNLATPDVDFSRKTFLVIDDFQGMRTVIRDVLRNCGANVKSIETAANGKDAIRLLSSQAFDVVLCDFNLGPGQNGQQVLEEAKVKQYIGPACAWIMITAEKTTDAVTGAAEYQPDAYLLKPITEATLRQRLAKIWTRKAMFASIDGAIRNGDYPKAIRLCDERLATDKANGPELIRMKADLLVKAGNLSQARQVFEAVLAERDFPWAMAGLAKVHLQNGDLSTAKSLLEQTIQESPYYLEAHDVLAQTLQAMGDLEAAAQALEHAAKLSPNSVTRQKVLGDVSLKLGRLDHAERAFRKSVTLGEHSVLKAPDAFIGLAKTCSAKDNPVEALKAIDQLTKTFSDDQTRLKAMAVEGIVHHQAGNTKKASELAVALEQEVAKAGALAPDQTSLDVARLLMATGKQDRAVEFLKDRVRNNPDNVALLDEVKGIFNDAAMGEEGAALVETSRQEGVSYMNKGVLLARDGNYDAAISAMREARQAMPSNVRVLFNSAYVIITCMQKIGVTTDLVTEAREALEAANSLAPGQTRYNQLNAALKSLVTEATAKPVH